MNYETFKQKHPRYFDGFGMKDGWMLASVVLGCVLFVVLIIAIAVPVSKAIDEASCNQRAEALGVENGDYRLLSDKCFLTLNDGQRIDADQLRSNELVTR